MLTLCLDIGGTKVAVGLADADGALVHTAQVPTPARCAAEQVWAAVAEAIAEALRVADATVAAVGIASAGPVDLDSGTVSPINIGSWRGFPLRDRVAAMVPDVPVRLGGDGVCMALGEHWLGAGRGARFLLGMVVSTGVGGGWCSAASRIRAAPATRDTWGMSWSIRMACGVPAVAVAVSRRSPLAHRWFDGLGPTVGRRGPKRAPGNWRPRQPPEMPWRWRPFAGHPWPGRHDRLGGRGVRPRPGCHRGRGRQSRAPVIRPAARGIGRLPRAGLFGRPARCARRARRTGRSGRCRPPCRARLAGCGERRPRPGRPLAQTSWGPRCYGGFSSSCRADFTPVSRNPDGGFSWATSRQLVALARRGSRARAH
ncbi:ROK family protein [Mycobacterium ulcerans str. Harvey]|uniref:ROK family protein n=1 Tax=Mycobacterium ulcerans str. Harvey TaxID=1299332 RepID=A0ABN0R5K1_MYCUL|nr:ROK family protein [Mycobacterium ulcerans str. Harvey]